MSEAGQFELQWGVRTPLPSQRNCISLELAAKRGVRASRIAHGVPMGGEPEYVDGGTLAHALAGRQLFG